MHISKIAVLITCHNRREKTIECLRALYSQCKIGEDYDFWVFLVDDGSTDGTKSEIEKLFPNVKVIEGDGSLFWNRGMIKAWEIAAMYSDFDYFLWLNDDTYLLSDCLEVLLRDSKSKGDKAIIVGTTTFFDGNKLSYGGYTMDKNELLIPQVHLLQCDYFNGNIVLIPQYVFKKIGFLDKKFKHAIGDFEYGLRAKKYGVKSFISSKISGKCDKHDSLPKWCNPEINISQRIKFFNSPLGPDVKGFFYFEKKYYGLLTAVFHWYTIHFRLFFPSIWKNR